MSKKKKDPNESASLSDIVELLARPDEHERDWSVLLKGGPAQGDAVLSHFWGQVSYFERADGALGVVDSANKGRAVTRDGGRTYDYTPRIELPDVPASETRPIVGGTGAYNGPAGVVKMQSGRLGLTWTQVYPIEGNQQICSFYFRSSGDDGRTWSEDVLVNPGHDKGTPLFDTLRQLQSGRLIQPVRWCLWGGEVHRKQSFGWADGERISIEGHGHHPEFEAAYCYYSDDEGKTWSRSKAEILGYLYGGWGNFVTSDEPALDQLPDGRLLMHCRSELGRMYRSFSKDGGLSWSRPAPLQMAASYTPHLLRRIPSTGHLLLIWNQSSRQEIVTGLHRHRLSCAVSKDEGETWENFKNLESLDDVTIVTPPPADLTMAFQPHESYGYYQPSADLKRYRRSPGVLRICYPDVAFVGDEAIIVYDHGFGILGDEKSGTKLRAIPVGWFTS